MRLSRRNLMQSGRDGRDRLGSASAQDRTSIMKPEYRKATDLLQALRQREVSSLELTEQAIARIEAQDGRLNAVPVRDFDRARTAAKGADAALARGETRPLLGLPMTVKESFNVAGLPTTWGIAGTKEIPVSQDAVAVTRLKAAGAVILGKSNIAALLADWQSDNPVYGRTANPYDTGRTPGGSSGGAAAALAAGYVALEMGSDIAGSLRAPAHYCGVYAHKPTLNLLPLRGHAPPGSPVRSVDTVMDLPVIGPMARSAGDLILALDVLAGPDEAEATAWQLRLPPPRFSSLKEARVLVLDSHPLVPSDASVRAITGDFAAKLEKAGCRVARSSPLLPDLAWIADTYRKLLFAFFGATMPEKEYAKAAAAGQNAMVASHRDWMQGNFVRTAIAESWRGFFRAFDILLCPVMPTAAFPHDRRPERERTISVDGNPVPYDAQFHWAGPATLNGLPATAFPAGLTQDGLPAGLQAIGSYLEDRTPLQFAALAEQAFGGFRPPPTP